MDPCHPHPQDIPKTLPSSEQTFECLRVNREAFDPAKVRLDEITRAAVFAARRKLARRRGSRGVASG